MAIFDTVWYLNYGNGSSTGYYAVAPWAASTAYSAGQMVRQLATPTVGNERVFACIIAGTSGSSEPSWNLTYGAKTTDGGATWIEVTGRAGVNGDTTNAGTRTASRVYVLGQLIYDSVTASIQIITTAGTSGSGTAPSFSATAGVTTTDNSAVWTSLGLASSFSAWGAPHARLQTVGASGFMAAGNICYVSGPHHAETQAAAMTLSTSNGTYGALLQFLSVNDSVAPPTTLSSGASVSTTGANALTLNGGYAYYYGISFLAGSSTNTANLNVTGGFDSYYDTCTFTLNNSSTSSVFSPGSNDDENGVYPKFINCSFVFGSTSQGILKQNGQSASAFFTGCTFAATGSVPSQFLSFNRSTSMTFRDCNLSAITGTLAVIGGQCQILFQNCSLGSGVTLPTVPSGQPDSQFYVHNCDSAATNYRYYFTSDQGGSVKNENTIVRTGGATNGSTPISWNFTTGTYCSFLSPFVSEEIAQWNTQIGSPITATIYLTSNTALDNSKVWIEFEYPGSSSNPLGASVNTRMPLMGTATALTSDTSTWGGSTTYKYKIQATFTPLMTGIVKGRVYMAIPSTTLYVDPLMVL